MSDEQDYTIDPTLEAECDALLLEGEDLQVCVAEVVDRIFHYKDDNENAIYDQNHLEAYFERFPKDCDIGFAFMEHQLHWWRGQYNLMMVSLHETMNVNRGLSRELNDRKVDILHLQEQVALARDLFDQARRLRGGLNEFVASAKEFQRKDKSVAKRLQVVQDKEGK